jgi:hypothetical protein
MKFTNTSFTDPIKSFYKAETICGTLNVFSLTAVSMVWGHMLGLLNLWFLPLTITCLMIGYGSEIQKEKLPKEIADSTVEL